MSHAAIHPVCVRPAQSWLVVLRLDAPGRGFSHAASPGRSTLRFGAPGIHGVDSDCCQRRGQRRWTARDHNLTDVKANQMETFPACAAFDATKGSIFRITVTVGSQAWRGTGFAIAQLLNSNRLIVASAKHVIDVPIGEPVSWHVEHYSEIGDLVRESKFSSHGGVLPDVPFRTHKALDVGLLFFQRRRPTNRTSSEIRKKRPH